jgi:non-canonical (house-cleaning) NTP pyrophosphatase
VAELIRNGKELGEADDIVFGESNSKQKMGAVGLLTNNVIDRTEYYTHAVILALIRFKNANYFHE